MHHGYRGALLSVAVLRNSFHSIGKHWCLCISARPAPTVRDALLLLSVELNGFSVAVYPYERSLFGILGRWKAFQEIGPLSFNLCSPLFFLTPLENFFSRLSFDLWGSCIEIQGSVPILCFKWNLMVRVRIYFLLYVHRVLEANASCACPILKGTRLQWGSARDGTESLYTTWPSVPESSLLYSTGVDISCHLNLFGRFKWKLGVYLIQSCVKHLFGNLFVWILTFEQWLVILAS